MTKRPPPATAFKKGVSGNPCGKPPGTRSKSTMLLLSLMQSGAEEIAKAVIDAAKGGDLTAARIVLDRLVPLARERPVSVALPATINADGIAGAQSAILQAVAAGELLPSEAATISGIIEARRRAIETVELDQRLSALEERAKE